MQTGAISRIRKEPSRELPAAEQWIGQMIGGKYRVSSILGEGGFGTVYRVEMALLGDDKSFALKLLHPELCRSDHFRARFIREASIALELVHPNAIPVREFGQTEDGQLFFTMDYCPGESLKQTLTRESYLTVDRAIKIVTSILGVLEAAHEKQIIHRDLKPENIFLERSEGGEERVKVGDFGLARPVNPDREYGDITNGGIVGTPRYMAPEQARGEPLDARCDLYSVGVMFFEMISGELPPRLDRRGPRRPGALGTEAVHQLRQLVPARLVVPVGVIEIIARALEPKPAGRYQSATEFREALEALPTYTPTYLEPRAGSPRRPRWSRVLWIALGGIGGLLVMSTDVRDSVEHWIRRAGASMSAKPDVEAPESSGLQAPPPVDFKRLTVWVPYLSNTELKFRVEEYLDGMVTTRVDRVVVGLLEDRRGYKLQRAEELENSASPSSASTEPRSWWSIDEQRFVLRFQPAGAADENRALRTHDLLIFKDGTPLKSWSDDHYTYAVADELKTIQSGGKTHVDCLQVTAQGKPGARTDGVEKRWYYRQSVGEVLSETYENQKLIWRRERQIE
ncbi:MAG: serine/threonine-protein kinase [Planctomycetota bacterium]